LSESLQTALASTFALVVGLLIIVPLLLAFLASQVNLTTVADRARRRAALAERVGALRTSSGASRPLLSRSAQLPTSGGSNMPLQRRRLMLGLGILALAAVVGFIGWYKLAGEPLLNRQIPYLASAGIAVVILAALGGALLVADQLRGDDYRIEELEAAVRTLADSLAPAIEAPARLRAGNDRSGDAGTETASSRPTTSMATAPKTTAPKTTPTKTTPTKTTPTKTTPTKTSAGKARARKAPARKARARKAPVPATASESASESASETSAETP
jgi:hypothetical protein